MLFIGLDSVLWGWWLSQLVNALRIGVSSTESMDQLLVLFFSMAKDVCAWYLRRWQFAAVQSYIVKKKDNAHVQIGLCSGGTLKCEDFGWIASWKSSYEEHMMAEPHRSTCRSTPRSMIHVVMWTEYQARSCWSNHVQGMMQCFWNNLFPVFYPWIATGSWSSEISRFSFVDPALFVFFKWKGW
jgi:hypothetical protein